MEAEKRGIGKAVRGTRCYVTVCLRHGGCMDACLLSALLSNGRVSRSLTRNNKVARVLPNEECTAGVRAV